MIQRGPNSCVLGQMTEPVVCLEVKLFGPSIFNSDNFWSSVASLALDIETEDEKRFCGIRSSYRWQEIRIPILSSKKTKVKGQAIWCGRHFSRFVSNSGNLKHRELPNILPKDTKARNFEKCSERFNFSGKLLDKEAINLVDFGSSKFQ